VRGVCVAAVVCAVCGMRCSVVEKGVGSEEVGEVAIVVQGGRQWFQRKSRGRPAVARSAECSEAVASGRAGVPAVSQQERVQARNRHITPSP